MSAFNFAIAGLLQPYQPLPAADGGIARISAVARVKRLDDHEQGAIGAGGGIGERDAAAIDAENPHKQQVIAAYTESRNSGAKRYRRVWKAEDLMTSPVNTLYPNSVIREAWDLHHRKGFRHIPIIDAAGILQGMLSDRDLLRSAQARQIDQNSEVSKVMTKKVLTCFPESSLRAAAEIMLRENFSALPVIQRNCQILGILTTSDILAALVHEAPLDLWV